MLGRHGASAADGDATGAEGSKHHDEEADLIGNGLEFDRKRDTL